jgi:hypothetical protein
MTPNETSSTTHKRVHRNFPYLLDVAAAFGRSAVARLDFGVATSHITSTPVADPELRQTMPSVTMGEPQWKSLAVRLLGYSESLAFLNNFTIWK